MPIDNKLLIEGRISDFNKKYRTSIDSSDRAEMIRRDPSKNQKYLAWAGKMMVSNPDLDVDELMDDITLFHQKIKNKDIYSLYSFDDLHNLVHPKTLKLTKRQAVYQGATIILNNKRWLIVAPHTPEQSRFFGGSTNWCISTSSETYWNDYYNEQGKSIIMILDRTKTAINPLWKVCIVADPYYSSFDTNTEMRDRQDNVIRNTKQEEYMRELGDDVVSMIDDYIQNDDGQDRAEEYRIKKEQEEVAQHIESGRAADDIVKYYFKFYVNVLPEYMRTNLDEDELKDFLIQGLGKETFDRIVNNFTYATVSDYGVDMIGYVNNKKAYDRYIEENSEKNDANDFYYYARQYVLTHTVFSQFIEKIVNAIGEKNYEKIDQQLDIDGALQDIIIKYTKQINDPNQITFASIPKTMETLIPQNIKQLVTLFQRYGYTQIADQIAAFASQHLKESIYKKMAILLHL